VLDIYVDADGCPVKEEVYRVAARYKLKVYVVANKRMHVPLSPNIDLIVVSAGIDAADDWIAEQVGDGDIAVTSDIPLAGRCLKTKGVRVLGTRGEEFREESIGAALAARELMSHLREMGEVTGGPSPMARKNRSRFLSSLDEIVQSIRRRTRA
jgi:uncharacterized protein YaiI (UPF0178 family)